MNAPDVGSTSASVAIRIARATGFLVRFFAAGSILLWIIGRMCTDRWHWSQWLFWIPTPFALIAIAFGLAASTRSGRGPGVRRNRLFRWAACGTAIAVYFLVIEHRFFRRASAITADSRTLHIVQWNAQNPDATPEQVISTLRELDADVAFLTDITWMTSLALEKDPLKWGVKPVSFGSLTIVSRVPIRNVRPLVARGLVYVALLELDTTARLGRPVNVYVVDMPSDPRISRADMMRTARSMLEEATAPNPPPPADMVIGDFNTPRGSWSMSQLFPGMHEAFNDGGHGYGATYHRLFPLYHIDHVLLNDSLRAVRCDLIDPGQGRHRAQQAWIESRPHS